MPTGPNDGTARRPGPATVTLSDVAAAAKVSPATVTRALSGHPRVRPETRARVVAATQRLGYVPNLAARALATQRSRTLGLLVPASSDAFWGGVAEGLERRAAAAGFSVLLAASHADPERERAMIQLFVGKRVDGMMLGSAAGNWRDYAFAPPMVLVNWDVHLGDELTEAAGVGRIETVLEEVLRQSETSPIAHVQTDDVGGAAEATNHLLKLGHRRIAFVGLGPLRPAILRVLGFRTALADAGVEPVAIVRSPSTIEGGMAAGRALLTGPTRPTAVVAFDDMVALGVIRAARDLGLIVPRALSVTGFDDVPVASLVEPALTTIAQDSTLLGGLAVEVILARLEGRPDRISPVLPGRLVVRESTGPAPEGLVGA